MSTNKSEKTNPGFYTKDTGGQGKRSTGIRGLYNRNPIPIKLMRSTSKNGPVKIIKPAEQAKGEKS